MARSTLSLISLIAFLFLAALGALWLHRTPTAAAAEGPDQGEARRAATAPDPDIAPHYLEAARDFRRGDLGAVRLALDDTARRWPEEADRTQVVRGLYEFAANDFHDAVTTLRDLRSPDPRFEDWRLYALAASARRTGDHQLATRSLWRLVQEMPDSPLRGRALLTAARVAWDGKDAATALAMVRSARREGISGKTATDLEVLAWNVGVATKDRKVQLEAAHELLIHSPTETMRLRITDLFRDDKGHILSWDGVLTPDEILQRAQAWMDEGLADHAERSLETVPASARGFDWQLLMAQSLTRQGEGAEAYQRLAGLDGKDREQQASLEWARAMAAAEQALAHRGDKAAEARRQDSLELAQQHLRKVIDLDVPTAVSVKALRELYGYLAEQGMFDDSMEMLGLLRQLDPHDRTGAGYLWERGWQEYQKAAYDKAIDYWTQLEQLYPGDSDSHRGSYWKARALQALGKRKQAEATFQRVVDTADTADFYVRQAAERLGGVAPSRRAGSAAPNWPRDPELARVLTLIGYGLDPLAQLELDILEGAGTGVDARDMLALQGILQVRGGDPRLGVQTLRAAFPALGGAYQASVPLPVLEAYYPLDFQKTIREQAESAGFSPALIAGIIRQESAFDTHAESPVGARGLMQLMPATAQEMARRLDEPYVPDRLFDPAYSVEPRRALLQARARRLRRQRLPGAGRLQRRPEPHRTAVARGAQAARPLPRGPLDHRVPGLRQADPRALGQLRAALPGLRRRARRPRHPARQGLSG